MTALPKMVWRSKVSREWHDFAKRMTNQFKRFDQQGLNHTSHLFDVTSKNEHIADANIQVSLDIVGLLHISIDGSVLSAASPSYEKPLILLNLITFKA
jgi:hypothetical protein